MNEEAYRRVALKLYALSNGDRAWMLARFSEMERVRLLTLLTELQSIGFSGETVDGMADAIGASSGRGLATAMPVARGANHHAIQIAVREMATEPRWLVDHLLRAYPWLRSTTDAHSLPGRAEPLAAGRAASIDLAPKARQAMGDAFMAQVKAAQDAVPLEPAANVTLRSARRRGRWLDRVRQLWQA